MNATLLRYPFFSALILCIGSTTGVSAELPTGPGGQGASYEKIIEMLRSSKYQVVTRSESPARLDARALSEGISSAYATVKNVSADFTSEFARETETISEKSLRLKGRGIRGHFARRTVFAAKGANRYRRLYRDTDLSAGQPARGSEPSEYATFDGEITKRHQVEAALGSVTRGMTEDFEMAPIEYFSMFGFCVETGRHRMSYLPTLLKRTRDRYKVLPKLEIVDGYPCHVLSRGDDSLWVDDRHGFAVRRRIRFQRTKVADPGCLSYVMYSKDIRKMDDGVWWPMQCTMVSYTTQEEPPTRRGKVHMILNVRVNELKINNVPDSLFEYQFPPGLLVRDEVAGKTYYMPQGIELLDKAIAEGVKNSEDGSVVRPPRAADTPTNSSTLVVITIASVVVLGAVIAAYVWRRRRTQIRAEQHDDGEG